MLTIEYIQTKYFKSKDHPYVKYESKINSILKKTDTILDAGCGRTAPILTKFEGKAKRLIGVDLQEPLDIPSGIQYLKSGIDSIQIESNIVDIVISRAVLEHIVDPNIVFAEISRILKKNGHFVFLAPNLFDYVSIASKIIPNRFHQNIVKFTEGRNAEDVFPAYYRCNTYKAIRKLCLKSQFSIISFEYLGQYPSGFKFNPYLFLLGTAYEKIISKIDLLRFLRGWLLVDLKKE